MERNKAHPKVKTKIGIAQDEQKIYKKTKIEDWHQIDRGQDHKCECDSDDVEVRDEPKALLEKAKTLKGSHETSDMSLRKENIVSGYDSLENVKNINALDVPFHSEKKEHPSDVDMLDLPCKKNVVKKLEENQFNSLHCISNRSKKNLKEKKSKAKLVRFNVETGVQHGTINQATSSTLDTSPTRKDGSMITFALKEARDLKHKANDLKVVHPHCIKFYIIMIYQCPMI